MIIILKYQELLKTKRNYKELKRPSTNCYLQWSGQTHQQLWYGFTNRYHIKETTISSGTTELQKQDRKHKEGHLTILGVYAATEGREELNE